jgi:transposase
MSRVEVLSGPERRRRWSAEQKRSIVAEAFAPGASVCEVARRRDLVPGQIYRWRNELRTAAAGFTAVVVASEPSERSRADVSEEFGIWPDKLGTLRVGQRYEVEVAENQFNGRTYRKITSAKPANGTSTTAAASAPAAGAANEEMQFVRELLAAGVHSGGVTFAAADLRTAIAMLRSLWRDMAREGR